MSAKMPKNESEWRKKLTPEQYHILREKGTEMPFTGEYVNHKKKGKYLCAGCGEELFASDTKFGSGCGWPSFYAPADESNVEKKKDISHFRARTEVLGRKCSGHLGHVFNDGPQPTGKRYCINSAVLKFKEKK